MPWLAGTCQTASDRTTWGISAYGRFPLRPDPILPIARRYHSDKEGDAVQRYRRIVASLGWLAAFIMAAGAGWKSW